MQDIQWKPKVQRKVEIDPENPSYEQLLALRKKFYDILVQIQKNEKLTKTKSQKVKNQIEFKTKESKKLVKKMAKL